ETGSARESAAEKKEDEMDCRGLPCGEGRQRIAPGLPGLPAPPRFSPPDGGGPPRPHDPPIIADKPSGRHNICGVRSDNPMSTPYSMQVEPIMSQPSEIAAPALPGNVIDFQEALERRR